METPDGKNTLHSTVGICYQNKLPDNSPAAPLNDNPIGTITGRLRRSFDGKHKEIDPFSTSLKRAQFKLKISDVETGRLKQKNLDFLWLLQSFTGKLPLFNGFFSRFVRDDLPQTMIAYMDPISLPPTRNDVVRETMVRSLKVADETNQKYAVVTYDLAVAPKAYSIQALQEPAFDKIIILLGNFHLELAFSGALGTYIADSGIEYILTESGVLAEVSLSGFMKGKFYNRSTRTHQILAGVLEQALLTRFLELLTNDEKTLLLGVMDNSDVTAEHCQTVANEKLFNEIMTKYDTLLHNCWVESMVIQLHTGQYMCILLIESTENYNVQ